MQSKVAKYENARANKGASEKEMQGRETSCSIGEEQNQVEVVASRRTRFAF